MTDAPKATNPRKRSKYTQAMLDRVVADATPELDGGLIELDRPLAFRTIAQPAQRFELFRSGSSRPAEFRGCELAAVPAGTVAGELSRPMVATVIRATSAGLPVFIDSGAFGEVNGKPCPDFDQVLAKYEHISNETTRPELLSVVAPDKVGDQAETLVRLARYADRVRALIARGVRVLMPLQKGAMSLEAFHAAVVDVLGTDAFACSIPSCAAAVSEGEALEFVAAVQPADLHLLGRGDTSALAARFAAIAQASPATRLTADAVTIRKVMTPLFKPAYRAVADWAWSKYDGLRDRAAFDKVLIPQVRAQAIASLVAQELM